MTILLIGPHGFVGRHLKARLIRDGHTVIDAGRDYTYIPDPDGTDISAIINCAGEITDAHHMYASNVALVEKMLRFARDAKIPKVIHIGSSSEYGHINEPRREDMLCVPTDLYSATKIAATALCQGFAHQYDMDVVVVRPFSLYGSGDTPRKLIPRLLTTDNPDCVKVTHAPRHDYVYIDDFVDGLVKLLDCPIQTIGGDIVNFGSGRSTTNRDVVITVARVWGKAPIYEFIHSASSHDWVADTTKARERYGWTAKTTLEEGLRKTIALS